MPLLHKGIKYNEIILASHTRGIEIPGMPWWISLQDCVHKKHLC